MDNYHIELSIVAFKQLKSIGDYISYVLLEPDTSRRLIKGLRSSISNLSTFPYRYPSKQLDTIKEIGYIFYIFNPPPAFQSHPYGNYLA
jgi:hypothetical protein